MITITANPNNFNKPLLVFTALMEISLLVVGILALARVGYLQRFPQLSGLYLLGGSVLMLGVDAYVAQTRQVPAPPVVMGSEIAKHGNKYYLKVTFNDRERGWEAFEISSSTKKTHKTLHRLENNQFEFFFNRENNYNIENVSVTFCKNKNILPGNTEEVMKNYVEGQLTSKLSTIKPDHSEASKLQLV